MAQLEMFADSIENQTPNKHPEKTLNEKEVFKEDLDCYVCVCGSDEVYVDYGVEIHRYLVHCGNDDCEIEIVEDEEKDALKAWNQEQVLLHKKKEKNEKASEKK